MTAPEGSPFSTASSFLSSRAARDVVAQETASVKQRQKIMGKGSRPAT
jgi:hypothetical protein